MKNIGTGILFSLLLTSSVQAVDFKSEIEPILQAHCSDCHGPDLQESRFRLDRLASMLSGGDSGEPAIVPGKPEESHLVKLIRHEDPEMRMPPETPLSANQIQLIENWIREGAQTPPDYGPAIAQADLTHWSFQPVKRPEAAGIDEFILKKLSENGLEPSPEAEKRVLIRRLYLVMLGLPPTPEQVEAFVSDERADAWQHLVEEVLASPRYGERWATYWLDLVRFGETHGFETNRERPNAWRYRDWVIESLNQDKPYNDFVREQIAGDALGADVGTGFLVAGPYDIVKGQDSKLRLMQRMNELDDIINATGTAFLGLTTGCARCHNHKFDPITQKDYYALQAVFAGVNHADRALPIPPETREQIAQLDAQIVDLTSRLQKFTPPQTGAAIVLDEADANHMVAPQGTAVKQESHTGWGDNRYTWWTKQKGQELVAYQPRVSGSYRIWLSWGAGYPSHSTDARYSLKSGSITQEIAQVNQQLLADGTGKVESVPRWSGFYDAGVFDLSPESQIVLSGGEQGTAVTADTIVLQPAEDKSSPRLRPSVNPRLNEERFPPHLARSVRFTISTTTGGEGCIDELEIYAGEQNVALASAGATATSSGDFVHPKHKLEHINDGQHGNSRSWIVNSSEGGWIQIDLKEPAPIDRIVWGRDREGQYADRLPVQYRIEAALEPDQWELLASSADRTPPGSQTTSPDAYDFDQFPEEIARQGRDWQQQLQQAQQRREELSQSTLVYAGTFSQPGPTHRLYRGEPDALREQVSPGVIEAFATLKLDANSPEQERRLALANWIVSENNPLTARVMVNRIWQFHFGTGIVDTASDFGRNGTPPSHPELLDWLASELMQQQWSLKQIHRLILNSKTWRQNSQPSPAAMQVDADSRLLWRFPPRRLEAEAIRDSILSVTGVLNLDKAGGPGFSPFEVDQENVRHYHPKQSYGPEDWRRMIYMIRVRQEREQVFGAFDCPDASMVVAKRSRSTTPLQALNLFNSQFVTQQADLLAKRLQQDSETMPEQIQRSWQLCFQRPPDKTELADSLAFIESEGLQQFTRALLNANEFVFIP